MNTKVLLYINLFLDDSYFLIGPGAQKRESVDRFIEDMGFQSQHYERIAAFDRSLIEKHQGNVLRYLAFSRKMITRQWVR